jgi:hypothetical protein
MVLLILRAYRSGQNSTLRASALVIRMSVVNDAVDGGAADVVFLGRIG